VYTDDKQKMFVDITTSKGAALFEGMFNDQTKYPNEYLKDLALGHNLLLRPPDNTRRRQGLEYLIKALNEYPSPAPMRDILVFGWQFPELQPRIDEVCRQYARTFAENKAAYAQQDGYNFRLHVARMAVARLFQGAEAVKDTQAAQGLANQMKLYDNEIDRLQQQKKW
jgi:hypothetical protein